MKKVITLFAAVGFMAIGFTSCKKDFTCVCTNSNGDKDSYPITNTRRPDAKITCEALEFGYEDCSLD